MPQPPAGNQRTALQRLVGALRRRLRPDRGAPPATVPGLGSGEEAAIAAAAREEPAPREVEPDVEPEAEPEAAGTDSEPEAAADEPPVPDGATGLEPEVAADGDARIDAARERLRARIEPPDPDAD